MAHSSVLIAAVITMLMMMMMLVLSADAEYPGVIELVGYSNRRARTHFAPLAQQEQETSTLSPPAAKIRADIETVKRNMKKYDRLLALDTKNLPEPQKDMLARIVERVARLKESLDIEEQQQLSHLSQTEVTSARSSTSGTQIATDAVTILPPTTQMMVDAETDPTLLLDETTLLELQNSMNEQAAMQAAVTAQTTLMKDLAPPTTTDISLDSTSDLIADDTSAETSQTAAIPQLPTTITDHDDSQGDDEEQDEGVTATENGDQLGSTTSDDSLTDATDPDDQFVAARSNNNIAAITAADPDPSSSSSSSSTTTSVGNQRTLTTASKLKHRATKRPYVHKATAAGGIRRGQRPGSVTAAAAAAAAAAHKPSTSSAHITKQKVTSTTTTATYPHKMKPHNKVPSSSTSASSSSSSSASTSTHGSNYGTSTIPNTSAMPLEQLYTRTPSANIPLTVAAVAASSASSSSSSSSPAPGSGAAAAAAAAAATASLPMVYDAHVNTSAIIDSLNTNAREEYYQQKLQLQQQQQHQQQHHQQTVTNKDGNKKTATAKPTKYHYYPHNQHIYLLPECAIQQVCNAVYVRLNYTQPLCACPSRYRDPCSASLNEDDQHTTKLVGDNKKKAITLAKTCEATTEMRECRSPKDWSLLALQNTRTGKSHYLVICRCPDHFKMEGPMAHDQPTYASVPGIRVFGMMCVKPGYSVRKPSSQPPKRYQLQKPIYRPTTTNSQYGNLQKDSYSRPSYGGGGVSGSTINSGSSPISANYQPQDQSYQGGGGGGVSTYQYLNRPESTHTVHSAPNFRPDQFTINNFPGSNYGRNNERRGESPIEAAGAEDQQQPQQQQSSTTQANEEARTTLNAELSEAASAAANQLTAGTIIEPKQHPDTEDDVAERERESEPEIRSKRSLVFDATDNELDAPEFPWQRVLEFEQTIDWDD